MNPATRATVGAVPPDLRAPAVDAPDGEPAAAPADVKGECEAQRLSSDRFEDRFDDLAAIAYRVTYRILGSRPDAEDLTQEALTRAYQRWRTVRGHAEPWVARVAANLALDAIRRGKRRPTSSADDSGGLDDRAAPEVAAVLDRIELVQLLRELPRRQREVVVLRYLADLPEADVARELGVTVGSVKKHASRGLAALRAHGSHQPDLNRGDQ